MEQNHNMLRGISENGGIVFYGVDSTEIVREMERLHKTSAVTTAALGRLLTAASMMGIMLKTPRIPSPCRSRAAAPQAACWPFPMVPATLKAMWRTLL